MSGDFYKKYTSATLAASGTQTFFDSDGRPHTGCVYVKVCVDGTYDFSFLFANVTDTTFADGRRSVKNLRLGPWMLIRADVSVCDALEPAEDGGQRTQLLFDKSPSKDVGEGEIFSSDPVTLCVKKGQYVRVTVRFAGRVLPCHEESIIPVFRLTDNGWTPDVHVPVPAMTGCTRQACVRVCFLGDSITQGIGTPHNSYMHYAARTAETVGYDGVAYWDIGLGYARAGDAASRGVWLCKAKMNDVVSVCLGVNDIMQGHSAKDIKNSVSVTVSELKKAGCAVLLQTVPPFEYDGRQTRIWLDVNGFIRQNTVGADAVFDCSAVLGSPDRPWQARFGGHPNEEGCLLWAKALSPVLSALIEKAAERGK